MVTQQIAINTARSFVQDCKAIGLNFDKVLLFGSYARDKAHEDSDIDLLLISKNFTDDLLTNLRSYSKININYPIRETHPYFLEEFNENGDFIARVKSEGIEIVD